MKKLGILLTVIVVILLSACDQQHKNSIIGYIEGKYIYVSSSASGILEKRDIRRGAQVKAGQLLYVLQHSPELEQLHQAEASLQSAEQNLANLTKGSRETVIEEILAEQYQAEADFVLADKDLKRKQSLFSTGAVGKADLDAAVANYQSKMQEVKLAKAKLAEAKLGAREHLVLAQEALVEADKANVARWRWQLDQKTVYAKKAGMIFDIFYRPGEFVAAGQPVLALLPPENRRVIFFVPENQVSKVRMGSMVSFGCDGCDGKTEAKIYYISPQAEYTPVVLYSDTARQKLVYRVEAQMSPDVAVKFHPGQPIDIHLDDKV